MSRNRIGATGNDFTVDTFNENVDRDDRASTNILGPGVISGLVLSNGGGLICNISSGEANYDSDETLTATSVTLPNGATSFIWIDVNSNVASYTATSTSPGGTVVGLGKVVTAAGVISSITLDNRQEIQQTLAGIGQAGEYIEVSTTGGTTTLTRAQYKCRVIKFTGALASNATIVVPPFPGSQWTFWNATTGGFTLTVKILGSTGVAITQAKKVVLFTDGAEVYAATSEV